MNLKRAILTGILLWVLIFFEVSILMFGFSLDGATLYMVHYIIMIFFVSIIGWTYFKKVKPSLKEGFILGVIYVVVGTILDLIITIPLFVKDYGAFFNNWLILGLLETIAIASIYGAVKKQG